MWMTKNKVVLGEYLESECEIKKNSGEGKERKRGEWKEKKEKKEKREKEEWEKSFEEHEK